MEKKKGKGSRISGASGKGDRSLHKKRKKKEMPSVEPETLSEKLEVRRDTKIEESTGKIGGSAEDKGSRYEEKAGAEALPLRTQARRVEAEGKEEKGEAIDREEEIAKPEECKEELLSFFLEDEEYAVDIMIIKEIIGIMNITFVPRADDYIRGIISLRGAIIPIFDLRRRLGLKEVPVSNKSRIIVISIDDEMVGLTVDGVAEVVKIRDIDIEPTPFTISGIDAEYIRGICRYKGRIVILLDVVRLLKLQEGKGLR